MKYIDADKLIDVIEKLRKNAWASFQNGNSTEEQYYLRYGVIQDIISFITSLQQEQPELPGIEEPGIPGKDFIPVEWVDACEQYGKWRIVKQEQPEVDLEKEIDSYCGTRDIRPVPDFMDAVARHFYELGCRHAAVLYDDIEKERQRRCEEEPTIKGWVARDENGQLNLFRSKPYSDKSEGEQYWRSSDYSDFLEIDSALFQEVEFDEPIEVELTIHRV